MQRILTISALFGLCACAGASANASGAAHASSESGDKAEANTQAPIAPQQDEREQESAKAAASVEPAKGDALPARVDAGEISRASLVAVLSSGVGRFLQKVTAEPHLEGGRFVGWRLVRVFDADAEVRVLRAGDTVLSVNGQGIERPEQFKDVWDQVAARDELVLLVQREGRRSELHYRIVAQ